MDLDLLKLFGTLRPYGSRTNDRLFLRSIRRRAAYFIKHSPEYRAICEDVGFHPAVLKNMKSLEQIPVIPTLYFKRNKIGIRRGPAVEVTSSGTGGTASRLSYSVWEICLLAAMAVNLGRIHGLFSRRPVHYIMLGYQPSKENKAVISKTVHSVCTGNQQALCPGIPEGRKRRKRYLYPQSAGNTGESGALCRGHTSGQAGWFSLLYLFFTQKNETGKHNMPAPGGLPCDAWRGMEAV